jgi:hypothetical protein
MIAALATWLLGLICFCYHGLPFGSIEVYAVLLFVCAQTVLITVGAVARPLQFLTSSIS